MIRICEQDFLKLLRELEKLWRFCGSHIEKRNSRSYMFVIKDAVAPFHAFGIHDPAVYQVDMKMGSLPKVREIQFQRFPGV
jgi:hypothetical protein